MPAQTGWHRAWRRLRGSAREGGEPDATARPAPLAPAVCVDAGTQTWWRPGDPRSETLVEAVASADDARLARRVAALAAGSVGSGRLRPGRTPGIADPAFCELLGIELLRAGRFDRAYALLAPACQSAWGSVAAFAAGHAGLARELAGARVIEVRALDRWDDPEHGSAWESVAELDVEYAVRTRTGTRALRRTVHLVDVEGRWRLLMYPPVALPSPR